MPSLFVRGIPEELKDEDALMAFFTQHCGQCIQASVRTREEEGKDTSWAIITMASSAGVTKALACELKSADGTVLRVQKFDEEQAAVSEGKMSDLISQAGKKSEMFYAEKAWHNEDEHLHLAYRVMDPSALLPHDITDCMWNKLGLSCICDIATFLAAKDGQPGTVSKPGPLGLIDVAIFSVGIPFMMMGLYGMGGNYNAAFCWSAVLCIPHYFNDFCCYQSHITRLLVDQIEAKLIIGYGLIFCIIVSIMMGWDARTIVIWVAIFPGICLVTFADACTFQAMTTRKTLELALIFLAVPFLITVWFGLRNNQQNVETIGWIPTFPIEEVHWVKAENMANGTDQGDFANTTASTLLAESQAKLRATLDQSQLLELALSMLQTNILLLVKTIYNHVMTPGTAMILQVCTFQIARSEI